MGTKFSLCFLAVVSIINTSLFIIAPLLSTKLAQFIIHGGSLKLDLENNFTFLFKIYCHNREKEKS